MQSEIDWKQRAEDTNDPLLKLEALLAYLG